MSGTRVVHCKREPYDVYIGRPSKWGNPFKLATGASDLERRRCLDKYLAWLKQQPELMAAIPELRGKTLGCWCAPKLCHGHALALLADGGEGAPHRAEAGGG